MIFTFPPPAQVLSINRVLRMHHMDRHRNVTVPWRQAGMVWYRAAIGRGDPAQPPSIISVSLPVTKGRKDPHNYVGSVVKPLVDGLVQAKAWPDDTPEWVSVAEPTFDVGGTVVTVVLTPMEGTSHG